MTRETPRPPGAPSGAASERPALPVIDLRDLLAGGREAIILHAGERYHLRVTANDKLILTK